LGSIRSLSKIQMKRKRVEQLKFHLKTIFVSLKKELENSHEQLRFLGKRLQCMIL
jgi:hypothetical protein